MLRTKKAFSLVEIIIVLMILGIGMQFFYSSYLNMKDKEVYIDSKKFIDDIKNPLQSSFESKFDELQNNENTNPILTTVSALMPIANIMKAKDISDFLKTPAGIGINISIDVNSSEIQRQYDNSYIIITRNLYTSEDNITIPYYTLHLFTMYYIKNFFQNETRTYTGTIDDAMKNIIAASITVKQGTPNFNTLDNPQILFNNIKIPSTITLSPEQNNTLNTLLPTVKYLRIDNFDQSNKYVKKVKKDIDMYANNMSRWSFYSFAIKTSSRDPNGNSDVEYNNAGIITTNKYAKFGINLFDVNITADGSTFDVYKNNLTDKDIRYIDMPGRAALGTCLKTTDEPSLNQIIPDASGNTYFCNSMATDKTVTADISGIPANINSPNNGVNPPPYTALIVKLFPWTKNILYRTTGGNTSMVYKKVVTPKIIQ